MQITLNPNQVAADWSEAEQEALDAWASRNDVTLFLWAEMRLDEEGHIEVDYYPLGCSSPVEKPTSEYLVPEPPPIPERFLERYMDRGVLEAKLRAEVDAVATRIDDLESAKSSSLG